MEAYKEELERDFAEKHACHSEYLCPKYEFADESFQIVWKPN